MFDRCGRLDQQILNFIATDAQQNFLLVYPYKHDALARSQRQALQNLKALTTLFENSTRLKTFEQHQKAQQKCDDQGKACQVLNNLPEPG